MCERCDSIEQDRLITTAITTVTPENFTVCLLGTDPGETPEDEREVIGHFHFIVDKKHSTGPGSDAHITIVDAEAEQDAGHGVSIPSDMLHAFTVFMTDTLREDPTAVMTDAEKAQFTADVLVNAYARNTN